MIQALQLPSPTAHNQRDQARALSLSLEVSAHGSRSWNRLRVVHYIMDCRDRKPFASGIAHQGKSVVTASVHKEK